MAKKTANVAGTLAALLGKIQDRLNRVGNETHQNSAKIAVLVDNVRLKVGEWQRQDATLTERIGRFQAEAFERETRQTARDQNNVQALVNLRDSTAKAFDQVKRDVETLLVQIQRLNERIGKVESQNLSLVSTVSLIQNRTSNGLPSDHIWLNKKLTGVYDTTDDLETRLKKLEAIIVLYENLRKAQLALAEVNGVFLTGPKV
jgi:hypothetical protein